MNTYTNGAVTINEKTGSVRIYFKIQDIALVITKSGSLHVHKNLNESNPEYFAVTSSETEVMNITDFAKLIGEVCNATEG